MENSLYKCSLSDFPSPFAALDFDRSAVRSLGVAGASRSQQFQRRSRVLAAARRRCSESGHDKISITNLAQDCKTSRQTIFNLIGDRRQVLVEAMNEFARLIDAVSRQSIGYPAYHIAYADAIWLSAVRNPDYARQSCIAYMSADRDCNYRMQRFGFVLMRQSLVDMQSQLKSSADLRMLAPTISSTISATSYEWAQGAFGLEDLRRNLIFRTANLLIGSLKLAEAELMESWLSLFLEQSSVKAFKRFANQ